MSRNLIITCKEFSQHAKHSVYVNITGTNFNNLLLRLDWNEAVLFKWNGESWSRALKIWPESNWYHRSVPTDQTRHATAVSQCVYGSQSKCTIPISTCRQKEWNGCCFYIGLWFDRGNEAAQRLEADADVGSSFLLGWFVFHTMILICFINKKKKTTTRNETNKTEKNWHTPCKATSSSLTGRKIDVHNI